MTTIQTNQDVTCVPRQQERDAATPNDETGSEKIIATAPKSHAWKSIDVHRRYLALAAVRKRDVISFLLGGLKSQKVSCFHGNNLLRLRRGPALRPCLRRRGRDAPVGVHYEQRSPLLRSFVALCHAEPAKNRKELWVITKVGNCRRSMVTIEHRTLAQKVNRGGTVMTCSPVHFPGQ